MFRISSAGKSERDVEVMMMLVAGRSGWLGDVEAMVMLMAE